MIVDKTTGNIKAPKAAVEEQNKTSARWENKYESAEASLANPSEYEFRHIGRQNQNVTSAILYARITIRRFHRFPSLFWTRRSMDHLTEEFTTSFAIHTQQRTFASIVAFI
ncbi:unnamed protein product [Caenorhabditis nigoni]